MKRGRGSIVHWRDITLLSVAILLSILGFFDLIPGLEPVWSQRILGIGLFLAVIFHLRLLIRKYYAGYSWYGILIRVGVLPGKVVRYEDIQDIQLKRESLEFELKDGEQLVVDLENKKVNHGVIHEGAVAK